MLLEREGTAGKEEAAPTPSLQNWGRSLQTLQPLRLDKLFLGRLARLGGPLQAVVEIMLSHCGSLLRKDHYLFII